MRSARPQRYHLYPLATATTHLHRDFNVFVSQICDVHVDNLRLVLSSVKTNNVHGHKSQSKTVSSSAIISRGKIRANSPPSSLYMSLLGRVTSENKCQNLCKYQQGFKY